MRRLLDVGPVGCDHWCLLIARLMTEWSGRRKSRWQRTNKQQLLDERLFSSIVGSAAKGIRYTLQGGRVSSISNPSGRWQTSETYSFDDDNGTLNQNEISLDDVDDDEAQSALRVEAKSSLSFKKKVVLYRVLREPSLQ